MSVEGFEVTLRDGGTIVPITEDGSVDKVVGEVVIAGFMAMVGPTKEEEGDSVLVVTCEGRGGLDEGQEPIGSAEGALHGRRGEGQREEGEDGKQTAHQGSQGSIWERRGWVVSFGERMGGTPVSGQSIPSAGSLKQRPRSDSLQ